VEGIEPPLLAEHDFESYTIINNYLISRAYLAYSFHMCKKM
jgi:hypothetical protein